MANSKFGEVNAFADKHKGSNSGVAKPNFKGRGEAPVSNAANSANPPNPGGLNVLRKVSKDGTFKTSN